MILPASFHVVLKHIIAAHILLGLDFLDLLPRKSYSIVNQNLGCCGLIVTLIVAATSKYIVFFLLYILDRRFGLKTCTALYSLYFLLEWVKSYDYLKLPFPRLKI